YYFFFFSSRRRHTIFSRDWSSDVCSSDLREGADGALGLKFYHRESAIPLSDRVPMLEAFGFRVIDERTYTVVPRDGVVRYLHDMVLEPGDGGSFDAAGRDAAVEAGLLAVWNGLAE